MGWAKFLAGVIAKVLSGRLFLTVCAGVAFLWVVLTKAIDGKDAMVVILLVANWYFTRDRTGAGQ